MSRFRTTSGDDHPDAAAKHLDDSFVLFGQGKMDGAAYLAGYVVECCLKSVVLVERGGLTRDLWHHRLEELSNETLRFLAIPSARTSAYFPAVTPRHPIYDPTTGWKETLRYCAAGHISDSTASTWLEEAENIFKRTVAEMKIRGDV